MKEESLV